MRLRSRTVVHVLENSPAAARADRNKLPVAADTDCINPRVIAGRCRT